MFTWLMDCTVKRETYTKWRGSADVTADRELTQLYETKWEYEICIRISFYDKINCHKRLYEQGNAAYIPLTFSELF
jgi:hypothetical protein